MINEFEKVTECTEMARSVPETINALKDAFRRAFADDVATGHIRSVFLIGSKSTAEPPYVAGDTSGLNGSYQDFDVHFLVDRPVLAAAELTSIRDRVDDICADFTKPSINIGWGIRDRHWKLVPDPDKTISLCVHVVICNRYDYQCRALYQPVLGSNMYRICEPLAGAHPGKLLPILSPSPAELIYSAGGAAWMLEQFHRALLLHWWERSDQDFMPFLSAYAWNVASSIMLELYSTCTGHVATRRGALRWLLSQPELPSNVGERVGRLDAHKEDVSVPDTLGRELVNASFLVSHWMVKRIHDVAGIALPALPREGVVQQRDAYSKSVTAGFSHSMRVSEVHVAFEPGDDPFAALEETAARLKETYPNPSPCEFPEFIAWLAHKGFDEATKLTIWSPYNLSRYWLSDDFAFSRGRPNLWAAQWGWETGAQALLQRLHERYTDRHTLIRNRGRSGGSESEILIARTFALLATEQVRTLGIELGEVNGRSFFDQARRLAEIVEPSSIRLPDVEASSSVDISSLG